MIRVLLDNVDISQNAEIDLSFVEKLDMELDEAFISIAHTKRADQYPMFSVIDVFEDNTLLFSGRISQDNVELSSFADGIYNHNVTLIEHTKVLEKFVITGKSFTQPTDSTTVPFYTLYDVVNILRKTARLEVVGKEEEYEPFKIPSELQTTLENVVSPEFNFKDVTLRQALNEVFFYLGGIARLNRNGDLIIDFFNELKNEIDFASERYKKKQSSQDYATNMTSDMLNSVNTELGFSKYNSEWYPGKSLWTTLRSDVGQFDFEQAYIPTSKPIYKVENTYVYSDVTINYFESIADQTGETVYLNDKYPADIASHVVERSEYETLERTDPVNYGDKTRRNVLVYDYARKNIKIGETYGLFDLNLVVDNAIVHSIITSLVNDGELPPGGEAQINNEQQISYYMDVEYYVINFFPYGNLDETTLFRRWNSLWRVKYTPIVPSVRYEVARDDVSEVFFDTKSIANQKLRIIDLERFTNNMKGRVNQVSSSELILSHKVASISDTYNVGDFTSERFVITKKEVIVQRDHYIVNYELNKNFNKMSQFMGIDQEIRQYEIGESGRTIDRDLSYNEYIEVYSSSALPPTTTNQTETIQDTSILTDTFKETSFTDNSWRYAVMTSDDLVDESSNTQKIVLPIYKLSGGNAFGFYTDFIDNVSAGNELSNDDDENLFDIRHYNLPFKYTNDVGRLSNMKFDVFSDDKVFEGDFNSEVLLSKKYPLYEGTDGGTPTVSGDFYVEKDNRERIKLSLLYHLLPKTIGDVVIGDKLLSNNYYISDEVNNIQLRLWNSKQNFTTRDKNKILNDHDVLISTPSLTITSDMITIDDNISSYQSYAITDENGYPFIMVNSNNKYIKFDFLNKRSRVKYKFFKIEIFETLTDNINIEAIAEGAPRLDFSTTLSDSITFTTLDPVYDAYEFQFIDNVVLVDGINFSVSDVTDAFEFKNVQLVTVDTINFNIPNPVVKQSLPQFIEVTVFDTTTFNIPTPVVSQTIPDVIAPSISNNIINQQNVTLDIQNSNGFDVNVYFSDADSTPDSNDRFILVPANTTESVLITTLDNGSLLQPDTEYLFYFRAWTPSFNDNSSVVEHTFTTQAEPTYDITFDPNGGTWSDGSTTNKVVADRTEGTVINSAPLGLTRYLFSLDGWSPNLPYTVGTSDATLTAQWSKAFYKVEARINQSSSPTVQMQVTSDSYGEQFQGILTSQYSIIADGVPVNETFELFLNAPSTFDISGVTYTLLNFIVNGASYNGVTVGDNKQLTLSNLQEDIQVVFNYSSGGGFEPI